MAQSSTRPGLLAGFRTAMPLEHCAVNCGLGCGGALLWEAVSKALALSAVSRNDSAMTDASAIRATAGMALTMWLGISRIWSSLIALFDAG